MNRPGRSPVGRRLGEPSDGSVLQRVRWRFVLLNLVGVALAPLSLSQMDAPPAGRAVYLVAIVALAGWTIALFRTAGRFRILDLVGPALVALIGIGAGDAWWSFGPMYLGLFLHSLYGERARVFGNAALYVAAFQVAGYVGRGWDGVTDQIVANTLGALVMAWVMLEMSRSLHATDVTRDRERVLAEASRDLLHATTSERLAEVAARGAARLAAAGGGDAEPRAGVWRLDGDRLHLVAGAGPPIGIDTFDLTSQPPPTSVGHLRERAIRLGPAALAAAGRAAGATYLLDHGLALPLSDEDRPSGMLFVQSGERLEDDAVAALRRFADELSLADRAVRRTGLLTGVVDNSADGIVLVDQDERLAFISPAVSELAGRPVAVGEPLGVLLAVRVGEQARPVTGLGEVEVGRSLVVARPDGRQLDVEVTTRAVPGAGTVLNIRDVSEQRQLQAEITYRAFFDPVTELPNRALFLDRLTHALARSARDGSHLAVALIDLDDFKGVNDRIGHLAGDELLRHVARQVQGQLRAIDTVARLGGDEFALLLEDLDASVGAPESCLAAALTALRAPVDIAGHQVQVTASGGIATSDGSHTAEQMLGQADLAMYAAKGRGKNLAVAFHEDMRTSVDERRELRDELEVAIDRDELRLHYQPVLALGDERVVGVEALVRWQHPTRGTVGPDRFIPLAEEAGLITPLGRWVLAAACRDLARWRDAGLVDATFQLNVNLSVRQLADERLIDDIRRVLDDHQLPATQLVVEVTETVLADDPDLAERILRQLHELGVGVAIDDFGTGYASFTYLRRFPVDIVKIDRSFVADVAAGPESAGLARAIVRLAGSLELTTVAEGIEDDAVRTLLQAWGCDHAQGWLWSPALPAADLERWLRAHTPDTAAARTEAAAAPGGPAELIRG